MGYMAENTHHKSSLQKIKNGCAAKRDSQERFLKWSPSWYGLSTKPHILNRNDKQLMGKGFCLSSAGYSFLFVGAVSPWQALQSKYSRHPSEGTYIRSGCG